MSKENYYEKLRNGEVSIAGRGETPAGRHPDYKFTSSKDDLHYPFVEVKNNIPKDGGILPILCRLTEKIPKIVKAKEFLPEHMQREYGYGLSAEIMDCYGNAIMFSNPNYIPKIGKDSDYLQEHYHLIPRELVTTEDVWELYNPYKELISFNIRTGDINWDKINHCAVILTPNSLIWSKNGSGLLAGLYLASIERITHLYDSLRIVKKVDTPFEHRFWRFNRGEEK